MFYVLVAFCASLLLHAVLRRAAHRYGLVDRPCARKTHLGEIPVVGGVAVGGAFLTTAFIYNPDSEIFLPFVVACVVILLTGLFDDLKDFSARSKFIGQLIAATLMVSWADLVLLDLGNLWGAGDVVLGTWAIPFTLFCVIGIMNAMNMIDGLDGLAGGLAIIAAGWLALAAGIGDPLHDAYLLAILMGALAAFLWFNLRRPGQAHARVFLGDAGSLFLGFVLVWFTVDISQNPPRSFYAISAVWILGVPVMDTVYVMLRRLIRGQNPFHADRRHVHHTLIFVGLTPGQACGVLLGLSMIFGAVGYFGWFYGVPEYLLTYGFLATFAAHCVFMQRWREILSLFGYRQRKEQSRDGRGRDEVRP